MNGVLSAKPKSLCLSSQWNIAHRFTDNGREVFLRRSQRVPLVAPINSEKAVSGNWLLNISATGALLLLEHDMELNRDFTISFCLPGHTEIHDIPCRVTRRVRQPGCWHVCVDFDRAHKQISQIEDYVRSTENKMKLL